MPAQEQTECPECGHTYDPTKWDECEKCRNKWIDEQEEYEEGSNPEAEEFNDDCGDR